MAKVFGFPSNPPIKPQESDLTDPESDLVPLAILDFGWRGCDTSRIDAYAEEIFLVDTVGMHKPLLPRVNVHMREDHPGPNGFFNDW